MGVACGLMAWVISKGAFASIQMQIGILALGLFSCCMTCHGELVRLKPHPRYLTSFYLMVSAGGALGGIFVTLIAPRIFDAYTELNIGIMGAFGAAGTAFLYSMWRRKEADRMVTVLSFGIPVLIAFIALSVWLIQLATIDVQGCVATERNFYGILRVTEEDGAKPGLHHRKLVHGRISHGWQFDSEELRRVPTSYYGQTSGIGLMFANYPRGSPLRVGVLGLGTGSIVVYGQPGDHFTFYEINANVVKLANSWFTYLADAQAEGDVTCDVVMGDARLSMERQLKEGPPHQFDVLVLDAFTGDAVPVHLLTCEAFEIYLKQLKPDGVIAVNVANRHLDLHPVIWGVAQHFDLGTLSISTEGDKDEITTGADWILVSANEQFLSQDVMQSAATTVPRKRGAFTWTDDFSNLFRVIKW
jgi:hypothetical protein